MPTAITFVDLVERVPKLVKKEELSVALIQGIYRTGKLQVDANPFDAEYPFTITSKDIVGQIPIGSDAVVRVAPKTPIGNLFRMLEIAYDLKSFRLLPGLVDVDRLEDVYERIALILANRIVARVRKGVFRDYVTERADLSCVRGRLLFRQMMIRLRTGSAHVPCEYQEHTSDLEDNQILVWTLWRLLGVPISRQDVRARLRAAYRGLRHGVSLVPISPQQCMNRRYHRLNEDYQALHALCRFFLEHTGPGLTHGQHQMIPFVVDMPKLFERFIALWLQSNVVEFRVHPQYVATLDSSEKFAFNIDLLLCDISTEQPKAVLDTKYKVGEIPNQADVEQVVAYAVEMGVTQAFLVYPSRETENFRVKVGPISVERLAFDLAADYVAEGQRFKEKLLAKMSWLP